MTNSKPMFNVRRRHRRQVQQLLTTIREKWDKAPGCDIDLAQVKVPGTSLFCGGNKGYERQHMPQLKGFAAPGSLASALKPSRSGKVDLTKQFLQHLRESKVSTSRYQVSPRDIRAAQAELQSSRIALRLPELEANADHKKFTMDYFVSRDGYLLDGHHGWATVLAYCLIHRRSVLINVIEVDMPIKKLIRFALDFTNHYGILPKEVS